MLKPVIGIGADVVSRDGERERVFVYGTYVQTLLAGGAIPLLIAPQEENVAQLIEVVDGVLLAGGFDCDPQLYGEERHPALEPMDGRRQASDLALARLARQRGIPTLGICLGLQVMNVAAGGTLIQDIESQVETGIQHASRPESRLRHDVRVFPGTCFSRIVAAGDVNVNSSHHQAVRNIGEGLRPTASAPDGVIEGLEDPQHPFYFGVQWHPEDMTGEESAGGLFSAFIEAARRHAGLKSQGTVLSPAVAGASE